MKSVDGKVRIAKSRGWPYSAKSRTGFEEISIRRPWQKDWMSKNLFSTKCSHPIPRGGQRGQDSKSPPGEDFSESRRNGGPSYGRPPRSHPDHFAGGCPEEFESPILQKIAKALVDLYQRKGRLDLPEALASLRRRSKEGCASLPFRKVGWRGEIGEGSCRTVCKRFVEEVKEERASCSGGLKRQRTARGKSLVLFPREHQEPAKRERKSSKRIILGKERRESMAKGGRSKRLSS